MNVIIDGVSYAPMPDVPTETGLLAALEVRFDSDAGKNITVRDYLFKLLETLWREGEGFSGKRPFGNSGWDYELYAPLVKAKFIDGDVDENGYVNDCDEEQAAKFVFSLIKAAFYGVGKPE